MNLVYRNIKTNFPTFWPTFFRETMEVSAFVFQTQQSKQENKSKPRLCEKHSARGPMLFPFPLKVGIIQFQTRSVMYWWKN